MIGSCNAFTYHFITETGNK